MGNIKTDWDKLCKFYMLEEELMDSCSHRLNWMIVSKYQKMSLDFILKFKDKIDIEMLELNIKIPRDIKDEAIKQFPKKQMPKKYTTNSNSMDLGNGIVLEGLDQCTVMSGEDFKKHILPHLDELCAGHSHEDDEENEEDEE